MARLTDYPELPNKAAPGDNLYIVSNGRSWRVEVTEMGLGFKPDVVGPLANLGNYADRPPGFAYLTDDTDPADLYFRQGEEGWSSPVPFSNTESTASIAQIIAGIEAKTDEDRLDAEALKNFAEAAETAGITPAAFLDALKALMGANKALVTDGAGEFDPADLEPYDGASVADMLGGEPGKDVDPEAIVAPVEWTELAIASGTATVPWGEELPRVINASASFTLTFAAMEAPYLGKRLTGAILIRNAAGGAITITLTNGDGITAAPTVVVSGGDVNALGASENDRLLIYYDPMPDGTVGVTPWGAI